MKNKFETLYNKILLESKKDVIKAGMKGKREIVKNGNQSIAIVEA